MRWDQSSALTCDGTAVVSEHAFCGGVSIVWNAVCGCGSLLLWSEVEHQLPVRAPVDRVNIGHGDGWYGSFAYGEQPFYDIPWVRVLGFIRSRQVYLDGDGDVDWVYYYSRGKAELRYRGDTRLGGDRVGVHGGGSLL